MLSCNKYASNVVEKAIKLAAGEYREALAQWLLQSAEYGSFLYSLFLLAKHQYGNYVIQSLLQMIATSSRNALKARLKENSQEISKSQYGRHVLLQLHKVKWGVNVETHFVYSIIL